MPGSPAHLFRRFFDVATSRRLTQSEESQVSDWLTSPAAEVFFAQDHADQRHGFDAACSVIASGIEDDEALVAALLHDVGKRHARLGLVGRSVASILILFDLPLTERMKLYRDHGLVAAKELATLGVPTLVIDFALHHHGDRPATIDPGVWKTLVAADQPQRRRRGRDAG